MYLNLKIFLNLKVLQLFIDLRRVGKIMNRFDGIYTEIIESLNTRPLGINIRNTNFKGINSKDFKEYSTSFIVDGTLFLVTFTESYGIVYDEEVPKEAKPVIAEISFGKVGADGEVENSNDNSNEHFSKPLQVFSQVYHIINHYIAHKRPAMIVFWAEKDANRKNLYSKLYKDIQDRHRYKRMDPDLLQELGDDWGYPEDDYIGWGLQAK